jgi:hypothetical protein
MKKQLLLSLLAIVFTSIFSGYSQCGTTFTDSGGASGTYQPNESITTTMCPDTPGEVVSVSFTSFSIESNFDFLKIYDGVDATAPLIGSYTGTTSPGTVTATSATGCLTFVFTSDNSVQQLGWIANVICSVPTPITCPSPNSVVATFNSSTSTSVNWTETGTATQWEVLVLQSGSAPSATSAGIITTSSPLVVSNLITGIAYNIYVRAICSSTDVSNWSNPFVYTTPSCPAPTQIVASNITQTEATFSWLLNPSITSWEVAIQPNTITTIPTTGILVNTNSYTALGLTSGVVYNLYVRSVCGNGAYSSWAVLSSIATIPPPLTTPVCGGQFFDNGGLNSNYFNGTDSTVTVCPQTPGEQVTVTFSTFDTETSWDALYVYDGTSITAPQIASANPGGSVPGGLPGGFWGTAIPGPFTSSDPSGCLTFRFRSDNSINKTGWNANVECLVPSTCPKPTNPIVTGITGTNATVSWTENGTATQWEVLVLPATSPAPLQTDNGTTTSSNPFQITGLLYSNTYKVYVKSICGTNDSSLWSSIASFTTFSTNCFAPTNVVVNSLTATSANISWIQNGSVSQWEVYLVPSGSPAPTTTSTGVLTPTNSYQATGLTTGTSYAFYVRAVCSATETSSWSNVITFAPFVTSQPIVTNTTQYSINQLVTNVLINNPCINVSNISSISGNNYGMATGIGYFTNTNPLFPISSGLILSTGNALNAHGPNTTTLSDGNSSWPGDAQLFNYIQGLGIDSALTSYNNASVLEFDFSSLNSYMSFNFLFASDEYGTFQCDYTDAFAFFLTDLDTGTTTNLAVIPGTTTPVSVVTIRNGANNTSCGSANPAFFDSYTAPPTAAANGASTNFNGQTVKMTASSNIIPNHNYHIKLVIADRNDSAFDSAVFIEAGTFASGPPECSDKIELVAFIDENGNGIKDTNEVNFTYGSFTSLQNNSGSTTNISSPFGTYTVYDSNPANVYDFGYVVDTEYAPYYTLGTINYDNINIPVGSGTQTLYFPITLTQGFNDVSVTIVPVGVPRPGFSYVNKLVYKNLGIVATSGTLSFTKDPNVNITNVSQNGTIANTNGFTYNFSGLAPYETRYIYVTMNVPSTVALGTLLTNSSTITAASNDINLNNNSHSSTQVVVASYDPNDKMESHGEKIQFSQFSQNEYLYYTIRFQNNGTANAINVRIEDFLDAKIDEQSIRVVSSSHNYIMERVNNKITWNFNYIQLPSYLENADLCKGYVTFKVKLRPGFAAGDIIPNTASIYFDNNAPVITNTFHTEFLAALANITFNNDNFVVYPNPANSFVQISLQHTTESIQNITIYDVLGKSIKVVKNSASNEINIDVSDLSKGVYLLEVTTDSNLKLTKKLVIN